MILLSDDATKRQVETSSFLRMLDLDLNEATN